MPLPTREKPPQRTDGGPVCARFAPFTAMACLGRGTRVPGEFAVSTISNGESNFSDPTWYVLLSIEYLTWYIFFLLVRLRRNRAVKAALPFALTG